MNNAYTSRITKRLLSTLALVILPLLAVSQTQAKVHRDTPGKSIIAIISMTDLAETNINDPAELKARLAHLMARSPKAVKVLIKGSACPAATPQDLVGFWGCLKSCVGEVGVSAYSMIMCGAACVGAGTGIGAIACAACVGVSVTVIEACALGCVIGRGIAMEESQVLNIKKPSTPPRSPEANLRLQPARSKA